MVTCRFGVRRQSDDGSVSSFEVFDRATGAAVASGMIRADAEAEARRRNRDTSGPAPCLQQPNLARLQPPAAKGYLPRAQVQACVGQDCRVVVARAAQALDELRDALAHVDRLIAEQQRRLEEVYEPFTAREP